MRFVVTGSNGLVGSRLCAQLTARGHTVLGLSLGARLAHGPWEYQELDLTDGEKVHAAIGGFKPDVAINTAAVTDVDGCERNKALAYAVNTTAAGHVSRATAEAGGHLVHVSTDYVFDGDKGPYHEGDVPNPRGTYALTKYLGEGAAQVFSPTCAIARTAVVFGWPEAERPNFASWILTALNQGKQVKLFEDQYVSPSLADNVAEILVELGERKLSGVYNSVGADIVDRVTFGKAVCAQFGFDPALIVPTRMADAKLPSPRPARSGLLTDKVSRELTTKPLPLAEALRRLHQAWQHSQR